MNKVILVAIFAIISIACLTHTVNARMCPDEGGSGPKKTHDPDRFVKPKRYDGRHPDLYYERADEPKRSEEPVGVNRPNRYDGRHPDLHHGPDHFNQPERDPKPKRYDGRHPDLYYGRDQ